MAGSSFGSIFRITSFGESHGAAVGVVIDGCPPGIEIKIEEIQAELDRRRTGQSDLTTPRKEKDTIHILSGYFEGKTTGTPIALVAYNEDVKSEDYNHMKDSYRPSHADYTYDAKYGFRDWRGSGRASARETLARVAAGAIAQKYLKQQGIEIISFVQSVGEINATINLDSVSRKDVEATEVRCPDPARADQMSTLIRKVRDDKDSVGGVVKTVVRGMPAGLGDPVFDKLDADLAKAMLSINATKGFEIGSGFAGTTQRGSQHNDELTSDNGVVYTKTNNAGGVVGGISNGENLVFRTAFKPVSTIGKTQQTITTDGNPTELSAEGRHDPCVLPRAVPIVDAMTAITLMDHLLRNKSIQK